MFLPGAKITCKDRWRQVLAEGDRITTKDLITIQPCINKTQLTEMKNKSIQPIVPEPVWATYPIEYH
ncbi:hypothetical protein H0I54_05040 [Yersinia kristensenii]|uniref:type II restriction endonuclease n=1 Tax=Enterobacterales TaxID=91347 RepID=UPI001C60E845|nr:hypothetical protein [Yersinia kristensenii]